MTSIAEGKSHFENSICPACDILPLETLGEDGPSLKSTICLDELEVDEIRRFAPKCDLCRILLDLRDRNHVPGLHEPIPYEGVTYRSCCGQSRIRLRYTEHSYWSICTDFNSVLSKRIDDRRIESDPLSQHAVKLMQHWMAKCERKHTSCFSHSKTLPTRVIDVRASTLKLIITSSDDNSPYVALSHCWGTCRSFLTTRSNFEDRKRGFGIDELPATFQDAVKVTKALGMPYLWIDSICILQGDREDWEAEGSKMADVYANCTLCIAAARASDDAEGFLKPRQVTRYLSINIQPTKADLGESTELAQGEGSVQIFLNHPVAAKNVYDPLDGRAWCLQERYLSPRIIFSDTDALRWECLSNGWFDAGRGIRRKKLMLPDVMPTSPNSASSLPLTSETTSMEARAMDFTGWYYMLEQYTTRGISFLSDKLPAVSALASRVAPQAQTPYLAGLWEADLHIGLNWYRNVRQSFRTNEPVAPFQPPGAQAQGKYLAPSWSWASYPGAIQFEIILPDNMLVKLSCTKFLAAETVVPGKNAFGEVSSGHLITQAPLLSFEEDVGWDTSGISDVAADRAWRHNAFWCTTFSDFDVEVSTSLDDPSKQLSGKLLGIPLAYAQDKEGNFFAQESDEERESSNWVKVYGILISRKEGSTKMYKGTPLFERQGCFSIRPMRFQDFGDMIKSIEIREIKLV